MGTITRSMNPLRAGVKSDGSSHDDSARRPLRRRRADALRSTLTTVSNGILKAGSWPTKMALTMTGRAPGAAPRWQTSHFCHSPAALMSRASSRQNLLPRQCTVLGVSHAVVQTLGSHAYRIGDGGAWIVTLVLVGTTLLSRVVRKFCCVGLIARTEIPCPCCRHVSELR